MISLIDFKDNLNIGEYTSDFINNGYNGYICDAIADFADGAVDIYNSDLLDWLKDNYNLYDAYIVEFGANELLRDIMGAQYIYIEGLLNDDIDNIIAYTALNEITTDEIKEDTINEIMDKIKEFDNNNTFEEIKEATNEILEAKK